MTEVQPPESSSTPEQRIEDAWSNFMDVMERNIPQTGIFLRLEKKDPYGIEKPYGGDQRAFILIEPVEDTTQYVVISRKGARGANRKEIESMFNDALDNVRQGLPQSILDAEYMNVSETYGGSPFIQVANAVIIRLDSEMEEEVVKKAIARSIELVKTSSVTDQEIHKAKSLSAFLDTLSSGETGPSSPPISPPTPPSNP